MGYHGNQSTTDFTLTGLPHFSAPQRSRACVDAFSKLSACRLTGEFERYLLAHFIHWSLTPTEMDVAILSVKGLSGADIAQVTFATHISCEEAIGSILQKSGCSSVDEFKYLCVEGFWDKHNISPFMV